MEHIAWAHWFSSPIVRDEFFVRRLPDYYVDIYSGPCREEVSNAGGTLNGIGAGGLGQVWIPGAGTILRAYTDLSHKPEEDFEKMWAQLPINAIVAQTEDGKTLCTGWTGSMVQADDAGREITITGGITPAVKEVWGTPMTNAIQWTRKISFGDHQLRMDINATAPKPLKKIYELIPVEMSKPPRISATTDTGEKLTEPWDGERMISALRISRGDASAEIQLPRPLPVSWATAKQPGPRALRVNITPPQPTNKIALIWKLAIIVPRPTDIAVAADDAKLAAASVGNAYSLALQSPNANPLYWTIVDGELPRGLKLRRSGIITGIPTAAGKFTFDVAGENPYTGRPFFEKNYAAKRLSIEVSK
jgi:hypothetical protein